MAPATTRAHCGVLMLRNIKVCMYSLGILSLHKGHMDKIVFLRKIVFMIICYVCVKKKWSISALPWLRVVVLANFLIVGGMSMKSVNKL